MGVEITGGDNTVSATADSDTATPLTVTGHSATQSADLIQGVFNNGGTLIPIFAVTPAGQLRVAAESGHGDTPVQGLVLVANYDGSGNFDIDTLTNSFALYGPSPRWTGARWAVLEDFVTTGPSHGSVMIADGLADSGGGPDVAAGWVVGRTLQIAPDLGGLLVIGNIGDVTASINSALSATGTYTLYTPGGRFVMVGTNPTPGTNEIGIVDATAQSASIASSNLANTVPAGYYRVYYTLGVTATQVGAATVQFAVQYTDDVGSTSQSGTAISLTGSNRDRGSFEIYLVSGNVTYSAAVVGAVGTGRYALHVRIEALG